jgi:hypothetical protein
MHPAPADAAVVLPVAVLALASVLTAEDQEVLPYLLSCGGAGRIRRRWAAAASAATRASGSAGTRPRTALARWAATRASVAARPTKLRAERQCAQGAGARQRSEELLAAAGSGEREERGGLGLAN